jgi:pimeloyl-ACP methyl ester carboxylesterase
MAPNELCIPISTANLGGELVFPPNGTGLVIFAHGSGSSRFSPRNQFVAKILQQAKLGTLLFDLLTAEEEQAEAETRHLRFSIPLLAGRLIEVTRWVLDQAEPRDVKAGYFGSSTGAAAALVAAAGLGETISAIVCRGGRPDLAGTALESVSAPTLLIVGGEDRPVIRLNEDACNRLRCERALRIIPGATHLFEESGALEKVATMASEWFANYFQQSARRSPL